MISDKIIIKCNYDVNKMSIIAYNFLPYIINYLYEFITKHTLQDEEIVLSSVSISNDWSYDVLIKRNENYYDLKIREYHDNGFVETSLCTTKYKVFMTEQEILDLYVISKMTNNKYLENYVTFIQEKSNEN